MVTVAAISALCAPGGTGCGSGGHPITEAVAGRCNGFLFYQHRAANRAVLTFRLARGGTCGGYRLVDDLGVTLNSNFAGFVVVTVAAISAFRALGGTGGGSCHYPIIKAVAGRIHIGIHIADTADGTGIGCISLLSTGRLGDCGFIYMFMSAFPDLNILDGAVIKAVGIGAHVGEDEILAAEPIVGGLLVGGAHKVMVHGADFLAVHQQVDHVGAVRCNPVFQPVGMQRGPIDAVVRQRDAVIMAAGGGLLAHGNDAVGAALENVAGIILGIDGSGGEHPSAAAAGILPGAFSFPLHSPRHLMAQNHRHCQVIAGGAEHAVLGGSCGLGQGVFTGQIGTVKLPAVVLGSMDALGGDDHIPGNRGNGNAAAGIGGGSDILPAHGDGNGKVIVSGI